MTKKITSLALALFAFAALAFGQMNTWTTTTTSAAVNATQLTFKLASVTNVNGPGFPQSIGGIGSSTTPPAVTLLYIDREAMRVASVNTSSNFVTVERGYGGTQQRAHVSGAKVWVGPAGFFAQAAVDPSGACTASALTVLPIVNITTGNISTCGNGIYTTFGATVSQLTVGAQLTAAATLVPTNPVHHITSSATTITTITPPAALGVYGGCITLIPDAAMTGATTSTGGNIALATTFVANKALQMCYDAGAAKWYPSY